MKLFKAILHVSIFALVLFSQFSTPAKAETEWQKNHPRRAQVNKRLKNQQKRVDNGLANGSLKSGQAQKIYPTFRPITKGNIMKNSLFLMSLLLISASSFATNPGQAPGPCQTIAHR